MCFEEIIFVFMFLDIHTHNISSSSSSVLNIIVGRDVLSVGNKFSLGIHPWYISDVKYQVSILKTELDKENSNFLFIGECGLDKVKGVQYGEQEEVFRKQIKFSEDYKKPLIIHCVKSYNELIKLKKELKPTQPWIVHGFNRKKTIGDSLIKEGMFLSFGYSFLNSLKGAEVLQSTPLNKLFFETDNNNEFTIEEVYILASEILNIDIETLKEKIKENLWQVIG